MKRIFTLLFAVLATTSMMAQMHGAMKFAGVSTMKVATQTSTNESDTIQFAMNDMTSANITLPEMNGMKTIPSFTINNVTFSMGADHLVTIADQEFTATVTVDGEEKTITGSSLSGTYSMADNSLKLTAVFQYGRMPLSMTYSIDSYYIKAVTNAIDVTVGGAYEYKNESVTYNVRKYLDGDVEKLDVEVPTYTLDNTVMGNLTLGTYTVKGLTYDEERGGFYRDYKDDGLTFHFTAEQGGAKTMDGDYAFNSARDNNILVKYDGSQVASIVNTFQMGAMPFPIVATFSNTTTGLGNLHADTTVKADNRMYNLSGQRVGASAKGIVIVNGKKYLKK